MRPTELQFRSPKEKTPDPYDARVTHDGRTLSFKEAKSRSPQQKKNGSFSKEERFNSYKVLAKKTQNFLGPGSYNDHEKFVRSQSKPCAAVFIKPTIGSEVGNSCYYYVGNNIVYEPSFQDSGHKRTLKEYKAQECNIQFPKSLSRKSMSGIKLGRSKSPQMNRSFADGRTTTSSGKKNMSINSYGLNTSNYESYNELKEKSDAYWRNQQNDLKKSDQAYFTSPKLLPASLLAQRPTTSLSRKLSNKTNESLNYSANYSFNGIQNTDDPKRSKHNGSVRNSGDSQDNKKRPASSAQIRSQNAIEKSFKILNTYGELDKYLKYTKLNTNNGAVGVENA